MTKFTWRILNCITTNDTSNPPLEIKTIFWQCLAESAEFTSVEYGQTQLSPADPEDFIEYTNLSQDHIIEWVKESMGDIEFERIQNSLDNKIHSRTNVLISPNLPWELN
jgi:hypothetical protein